MDPNTSEDIMHMNLKEREKVRRLIKEQEQDPVPVNHEKVAPISFPYSVMFVSGLSYQEIDLSGEKVSD